MRSSSRESAVSATKTETCRALARDWGRPYVAQRWNCFKFAQIRPDFVNYGPHVAARWTLTSRPATDDLRARERVKFAVSLARRFRHHFVIPAESDQCAVRP